MASQLPPLPAPAEPAVDPRTGLVNRTWYMWFRRIEEIVREGQATDETQNSELADHETRIAALEP